MISLTGHRVSDFHFNNGITSRFTMFAGGWGSCPTKTRNTASELATQSLFKASRVNAAECGVKMTLLTHQLLIVHNFIDKSGVCDQYLLSQTMTSIISACPSCYPCKLRVVRGCDLAILEKDKLR
jgi:hypothetical protein